MSDDDRNDILNYQKIKSCQKYNSKIFFISCRGSLIFPLRMYSIWKIVLSYWISYSIISLILGYLFQIIIKRATSGFNSKIFYFESAIDRSYLPLNLFSLQDTYVFSLIELDIYCIVPSSFWMG